MKRTLLLAVVLAAFPTSLASAQVTTNPIRYTWIATSCENWDCAASAFILSAGDKNVLVMPTGVKDRPWVILRRVEEGSIFIPEDEPFGCEVFTTMAAATARFDSMNGCRAPLMLSVPDGRAVVASLHKCAQSKQRVARH